MLGADSSFEALWKGLEEADKKNELQDSGCSLSERSKKLIKYGAGSAYKLLYTFATVKV